MRNISDRKRKTRLHKGAMEKSLRISTVGKHLERNWNWAGRFAPAAKVFQICIRKIYPDSHGHFSWVTAEVWDVVLNPS
jgi:hypothetical protein